MGCQENYESMLHRWADKMRLTGLTLLRQTIGEFLGTIVLIYFGAGVVAQNQFVDKSTFISISLGWGTAVFFGLFISGTMGCGLMNPALTLAFAIAGKVKWIAVPVFTLAQILGAYIGALVVYLVYHMNIQASDPNLVTANTGTIFVTGPSPVGNVAGLIDQIVGTAMLAALCCAMGDKHNFNVPRFLSPFYVGLLIFTLVGAFGTHAGAALNPARDFGPRLAILTVGYKDAFTHADYYFWVPIVGPYLGAIIGTCLYELTIGIHLKGLAEKDEEDVAEYDSDI